MNIRDEGKKNSSTPVSPIIISPLERIFPSNVPSTRSSLTFVGLRQTECEINEKVDGVVIAVTKTKNGTKQSTDVEGVYLSSKDFE